MGTSIITNVICRLCVYMLFTYFSEMKDLSSKMLELKMERTGSGESYGQGGVSPGEHEAERLAENGRLMEEMSTLQTQLTSEKAERIALETKSAQQQTAYDDLLAAHEMLKRENASIRNKYDDEKEKHNRLKVEHQDLKKKKIGSTLYPIFWNNGTY